MANAGKTVATLLIGTVVGAAVGYILGTDKEKRDEQIDKLKESFDKLKEKVAKKTKDLEQEIFEN
jgi:membrane protein YqaA with SNARE-associated domain